MYYPGELTCNESRDAIAPFQREFADIVPAAGARRFTFARSAAATQRPAKTKIIQA
jgi:hypothetical protein